MKDEGGRMKASQQNYPLHVKRSAWDSDFLFSLGHFSFFISTLSSFILQFSFFAL
jgi:hypothetical protein